MVLKEHAQVLSVIFVTLCLLSACGNNEKKTGMPGPGSGPPSSGMPGMPESPKTYSVLTLEPRQVTLYDEYPATMQGKENVEIRPKVDGYVEAIYVDEGASVTKGQRLFRINAPQYSEDVRTAEAQIVTARSEVDAAQMAVNKVRPLVEKDIISKYELESAEYTLKSKQATLVQAQSSLANAKTNLGYTVLTSPVNGVVGTIPYKIGSLVSSTTTEPLTTVSNISSMYAYFSLNEKQLLSLIREVPGKTFQDKLSKIPEVSLLLSDGSAYQQKGRVKTSTGQISTETGSMQLRATFTNPQALLRSGNSGKVRIPKTIDSAMVVPQSATYELQGKRFIYTVGADSVAHNTEIDASPTSDGKYFVVERGVGAGAQVVLDGVTNLKDGAKIVSKKVQPSTIYDQP
ncbi:efflux RND transporter periplasmic adaptor subunit [Dyadobacter chenwenxiniae]|uniref:Efflux RND transporter periplasmic adaptor subunit n=1 Tax=Dyadobacter chenwenxiniae TaxID=2906456 RepID=A0A9X1PH13_9BACT|nr:efflux RND transporter periplasmic adaptor subunit [Dyadobacter chenwenxiniae]MCF0060466.1 efflux RND transporter periplasmic adaptor subunit [Dyadobacter chenwenxiniae]UON86198.1 efflux RND transporter periplasmic adaptor subunit [Dyadobacter chenwenxiniae]